MAATRKDTVRASFRTKHLLAGTAVLISLYLAASPRCPAAAGEPPPPTAEQIKFFESKIRPVLAEHCYECHGPKKQTSDLRLDSRAAALAGGESGPAVVPGDIAESLLIDAVNHESFEMPPKGKLKDHQIEDLTAWVRIGAPWPNDGGVAAVIKKEAKITDGDRRYWFFQPLARPAVPEVEDGGWSRTPIDRFVFRRLKKEGLEPAPQADPVVVVRRVYFDLTGLPPTPEEVDAYLADPAPDRHERLVDRLLESPRYGERWARFWLDLVRFAESDGWRQDAFRPQAYKFRDYVIRSFNEDKPYDRFVMEQVAGDEIDPGNPDALIATSYLRHGIYEYNQRDVRTQWENILNEITDVTGDVFLGLGMGCARCHDHKFDPILRKDYYRLRAYFTPLVWRENQPLASAAERAAYEAKLAEWKRATAEIRRELDAIEWPALLQAAGGQGFSKFPPDIQAMMLKRPEDRLPFEHQLAEVAMRQLTFDREKLPDRLKGEQKQRWEQLRAGLAKFDSQKPAPLKTVAYVASDVGGTAPPTNIPGQRNAEDIAPGILTILDPQPATIETPGAGMPSTGRRATLARWLTDPENPLTTRVIVNRIWQYHFGSGLVATSSDFGKLGEPPSHPELLDWLARQFVADGWSFKRLHRLILASKVYRQSASHPAMDAAQRIDPENRLLWRMSPRRLDAEQIRDSMLFVTGELDLKMGGPSVSAAAPRRAIYTKVVRNTRDPLLAAFDMADRFASASDRNVTTTPTQALLMINGPVVLARAKALARQLRSAKYADDIELTTAAYRRVLGRVPTGEEAQAVARFLVSAASRSEPPKPEPGRIVVAPLPHAGGEAVVLKPDSQQRRLVANAGDKLPQGDFTIEAVVLLNSLYADATVRTIAAHWDSNTSHPGWALGVTSEKSAYTPRNLILQLVGKTAQDKLAYEVIPSGIHLELNTPYFVAASVNIADTSQAGVTFYVQNLAVANVPIQTANVPHQAVKDYRSDVAFAIGGRDGATTHYWDGLVGEVRLSSKRLGRDELLIDDEKHRESTVGHWKFETEPGMLADSSGNEFTLSTASAEPSLPSDPRTKSLVDFCHVLLNANEFIYVD